MTASQIRNIPLHHTTLLISPLQEREHERVPIILDYVTDLVVFHRFKKIIWIMNIFSICITTLSALHFNQVKNWISVFYNSEALLKHKIHFFLY